MYVNHEFLLLLLCIKMTQDLYLFFNVDVELTNTLKGELLFLHQDAHWFSHKLGSDIQHLRRHGG